MEKELLKALEAMIAHGEKTNYAFYAEGTTKAMREAMKGQKQLLDYARDIVKQVKQKESQ